MPVERKAIKTQRRGAVKDRILYFLSDGKGYYFDEILTEIQCNDRVAYRALSELQKENKIYSTTTPELGTGNKRIYYVTDEYLESQK